MKGAVQMITPITAALVISLLANVAAMAQAPAADAAFEAASIRQNLSGSQSGGGRPRAGGGRILGGPRLDSGTAPLDVVVIDRIERPSEN